MVRVYHVTSSKKLMEYIRNGFIKPPVRGWVDIKEAEWFAKSTGRTIILILYFNNKDIKKLDGHRGKAVFIDKPYYIDKLGFSYTIRKNYVKGVR